MNGQTAISGSLALNSTPHVIMIPASGPVRTRKLRVAAYARVSSNSEDQLHSFATQNAYYTELITGNPEWEFVDVYADEGITGTSAEKRDDFQRLLKDCRRGRIDKVLTKSTARFARNTSESLMAVRELRDLGVGVCFEEQGIDTAQMSGELLTAIFSMMAQKESETISENIRWTYQKKMKKGRFITCKAPFGYRLVGGGLEIIEAEAEIIRLIFQRYLNGRSMEDIAKEITRYGIPTRDKTPYWQTTSIQYVLHNEKYAGDSLAQKTYTTRTLPHRKKRNQGEYDQYFVPGSHPAIIDREVSHTHGPVPSSAGTAVPYSNEKSAGKPPIGLAGSTISRLTNVRSRRSRKLNLNMLSSACITNCGTVECRFSPNCLRTSRQSKTGSCSGAWTSWKRTNK